MTNQNLGQMITFYSYKGGTGRTMALANVAWLLAKQLRTEASLQGKTEKESVLMIDWDLDAPGLHRFFKKGIMDTHPGLIDMFETVDSVVQRSDLQSEKDLLSLFDEVRVGDYIRETECPNLYLMKAGRFDAKYSSRINTFQWERLYNAIPELFLSFAEYLARKYKYILIDSRTGLSDTSGICTMLMPEKLVTVFTPNRQSILGIENLVLRAADYRLRSDDLRHLIVYPLPSRIEASQVDLYKEWRRGNKAKDIPGYQPVFEEMFKRVYFSRLGNLSPEISCDLEEYFDSVQIQHIPEYAYGEPIAVREEGETHSLSITRRFEDFTNRLVSGMLPWENAGTASQKVLNLRGERMKAQKEKHGGKSAIQSRRESRKGERFHNPYHFVPISGSGSTSDLPLSGFPAKAGHITHERYHENTYSGRIICRLSTVTPTFIGDKEIEPATETSPKSISPFRLDGLPAIPSTSLRGVISSIVEAGSNSAPRVLDDTRYSYRKPFTSQDQRLQPLSAIGMIIVINGKAVLRPLTLPTIEFQPGRPIQLPRQWVSFFKEPNLKVYFGDARSIRRDDFYFETFRWDDSHFYYLKVPGVRWLNNQIGAIDSRTPGLNSKGPQQRKYLVSQFASFNDLPRRLEQILPNERGEYTRGILRVLGCAEKGDQIPTGRKHEIFIPYPEEAESWPTFPVPDDVVDRFHQLADQRTEDSGDEPLPFHPRGTDRNLNASVFGLRFRLKTGDLVYFRVEEASGGARIAEVALSSIWRGRVEERVQGRLQWTGTHRFFAGVNANLLPFNPGRSVLSVAEQMFGFVEEGKDTDRKAGLALAGRIYFSHGQYAGLRRAYSKEWEDSSVSPFEAETPLRILGSPKPPSPSLYFKFGSRGGYVRKWDLSSGKHHPQGRKFYLHHRSTDVAKQPWRSSKDKEGENCLQKVKITPIRSGAVFYFHIDFDNLSRHELGLLLYALQPSAQFRHKIGMGKPLGLGSVHIEPAGVFIVNRHIRYSSAGLFTNDGKIAPRYHYEWLAKGEDRGLWPSQYQREKNAEGQSLDVDSLRDEFAQVMDRDIKQALELLGDPSKVIHPVHTPLTEGNENEESETFRWFVANDQGSGQGRERIRPQEEHLDPVTKDTTELPTLSVHPWAG
jgi:CRISPR-associated protein (TIGR03986 family)